MMTVLIAHRSNKRRRDVLFDIKQKENEKNESKNLVGKRPQQKKSPKKPIHVVPQTKTIIKKNSY